VPPAVPRGSGYQLQNELGHVVLPKGVYLVTNYQVCSLCDKGCSLCDTGCSLCDTFSNHVGPCRWCQRAQKLVPESPEDRKVSGADVAFKGIPAVDVFDGRCLVGAQLRGAMKYNDHLLAQQLASRQAVSRMVWMDLRIALPARC
jgi:hypothetical protein